MNFLTVGSKLNKQIAKARAQQHQLHQSGFIPEADLEASLSQAENLVWKQYERDVRTGLTAMNK